MDKTNPIRTLGRIDRPEKTVNKQPRPATRGPFSLGAKMATVRARGECGTKRASFTRPSNTTTYTAGDVMSDSTAVMTFAGALRESMGAIQHATLIDSANQTLLLDAELWLFDTAPAVTADNAAIAFTDAELARLIGVIDFAVADGKVGLATSGAGGNAINIQPSLGIPVFGLLSNDIFGVLIARNAYVPVSAEIFTVILGMVY